MDFSEEPAMPRKLSFTVAIAVAATTVMTATPVQAVKEFRYAKFTQSNGGMTVRNKLKLKHRTFIGGPEALMIDAYEMALEKKKLYEGESDSSCKEPSTSSRYDMKSSSTWVVKANFDCVPSTDPHGTG